MVQIIVVDKIKTHILRYFFFRKSHHLYDNVEKYGRDGHARDDNIIRRMRFACWITKATDTPSEYVILIAFPCQQWLSECALILRYTYSTLSVLILSERLINYRTPALFNTVAKLFKKILSLLNPKVFQ